ncbi:caspase-3 [Paramuricea clavata]|uniref:Caspase-3 n=1 Tax=Paramuricea clavata TaxID=317549 RepID=A0A6S7FTR5_PARCT|nr:caspase-3 [Paramuricea clavata]
MAMLIEFNIDRFAIHNGFVLVIVNRSFQGSWLPDRPGAEVDKTKIVTFCTNFRYNFHTRDNLKAQEMKDVCEEISANVNFSTYDAFICFISSHGDEGNAIYGVDGNSVTVDEIVSQFKGIPSLANKPKLFFMQNCRGRNIDLGQSAVMEQAEVQADHGSRPPTPIRLPIEADILVSYSSVDGYEPYRDVSTGSWFITKLTEILNEHEPNMNLTDLLSMVNKRVARVDSRGRKQMPCFTSTLRKPVYFKMRRIGRTLTPDLL